VRRDLVVVVEDPLHAVDRVLDGDDRADADAVERRPGGGAVESPVRRLTGAGHDAGDMRSVAAGRGRVGVLHRDRHLRGGIYAVVGARDRLHVHARRIARADDLHVGDDPVVEVGVRPVDAGVDDRHADAASVEASPVRQGDVPVEQVLPARRLV
jgi:hypothetical protein